MKMRCDHRAMRCLAPWERRPGIAWCYEPAAEHGLEHLQAPSTVATSTRGRIFSEWCSPHGSTDRGGTSMEAQPDQCAGLDVHKRSVTACVLRSGEGGEVEGEVRTFGTMTRDLQALGDWLAAWGCTHVAMEATGAYWKPVYNVLEERFTLVVVNAEHVHAIAGRKTDVKDAEWIATLLRHGLLRGSFIPDRAQRDLRELTRYRTALIRERARG